MSQAYVYYPRGYRRVVSSEECHQSEVDERASKLMDTKVMNSQGDDEVVALYQQWRTSGVDISDWAYVSRIIRCAKRLMPSVSTFLRLQESNRRVHGMNFDFLENLVKVMHAQHTHLSPLTALELMEDDPTPQGTTGARKFRIPRPVGVIRGSRSPELASWLAHSGSIEAIVCTLYVLFGPKKDAPASALS